MLSAIPALAFDDLAAKTYGDIVASAGYSRRKLLDRMIAAQALVHRATLVTFNPDDAASTASWGASGHPRSLSSPSRTGSALNRRSKSPFCILLMPVPRWSAPVLHELLI